MVKRKKEELGNKIIFRTLPFVRFALVLTLLIGASKTPQKLPVFSADMILGNWMDDKNEVLVKIYKIENKYFGKSLWIQNVANPGQPLPKEEQHWIGKVLMNDFIWQNNEWSKGTIYHIKENQTYSAYITPINQNTVKVTGFVWIRLLSQSKVFHRTSRKR